MSTFIFCTALLLLMLQTVIVSTKRLKFMVTEDVASGFMLADLRQQFGVAQSSDITLIRQGRSSATYFSYDKVTGNLKTSMNLDRDNMCENSKLCCQRLRECFVELKFIILSSQPQVSYVDIVIQDRNDHTPHFQHNRYTLKISEKAEIDTRLRLELAKDIDSLEYSVKNYVLQSLSNDHNNVFVLHTETVANHEDQRADVKAIFLQLKSSLDREQRDQYEYELRAIDGGTPALTGSTTLTVVVLDENDNYPQFTQSSYEVEVEENQLPRHFIKQVHAKDLDVGNNAQVEYKLDTVDTVGSSLAIADRFRVDKTDGKIYLRRALDYEEQNIYIVPIIATDTIHPVTSSATLTVRVRDVNDEIPVISVEYLGKSRAEIEENKTPGEFIAYITVIDKDRSHPDRSNLNNEVKCSLPVEQHSTRYELKQSEDNPTQEYFLKTLISLDREKLAQDVIIVACEDLGTPALSATASISLTVLDVNDNKPVLSLRGRANQLVTEAQVLENVPIDTVVVKIHAEDLDNGVNGSISFSMDQSDPMTLERFQIKTIRDREGVITTKAVLDREATHTLLIRFPVVVIARDGGGLTSEIRFSIMLLDVNDNTPEFAPNSHFFEVKENQPAGTNVGQIHVNDQDSDPDITVTIHQDDIRRVPFQVHHTVEGVSRRRQNFLVTKEKLDREERLNYSFKLVARDGVGHGSRTSTGIVNVRVIDINDNTPEIVFPSEMSSNHSVSFRENIGFVVIKVIAVDKDAVLHDKEKNNNLNGQFFFSLVPDNKEDDMFDIDPTTGDISVHRKMTSKDQGAKTITLMVTDQGQPKLSSKQRFTIVIDDSIPHLPRQNGYSPSNNVYEDAIKEGSDYNSTMIVVLIFFLFLLVACVLLIIYIRHWSSQNNTGQWLPNVFACSCCFNRERAQQSNQSKTIHHPHDGDESSEVINPPKMVKADCQSLQENCCGSSGFYSGPHEKNSCFSNTMSYSSSRNYEPVEKDDVIAASATFRTMPSRTRLQSEHLYDTNSTPRTMRRLQFTEYDSLATNPIQELPSILHSDHLCQTMAPHGAATPLSIGSPRVLVKPLNLSIDSKSNKESATTPRPMTIGLNMPKSSVVEQAAFSSCATTKTYPNVQASFV